MQLVDACEHVARRPLEHDAPAVEYGDAVRPKRRIHVMGGLHDGDPALRETVEDAGDVAARPPVEHRGRLVEQQRARLHRERPRERDALPLPARQAVRVGAGQLAHPDGAQGALDELRHPRSGNRPVLRAERDVVGDGARHHLVIGPLEDEGDPVARAGGAHPPRIHLGSHDLQRPRFERDHRVQGHQQRRLARPVGAQDA